MVFMGIVLDRGLGFVTHLLMVRLLGPDNFGAVAVGITIASFATIVSVMGLSQGVARYLPRSNDNAWKQEIIRSGFHLGAISSTLIGGLIVVSAQWLATVVFNNGALTDVIRIFGLTVPAQVLLQLSLGTIRGEEQTRPKIIVDYFILPVSRLSFVFMFLFAVGGKESVAAAFFISYVFAGSAGLYFVISQSTMSLFFERAEKYKTLVRFSLPLMIAGFSSMVIVNIDIIILGYFVSPSEVGVYKSVYPLAAILTIILLSFSYMLMPVISELHSDGKYEEARLTYQRATKWIITVTIPLFFVFVSFPDVLIQVFFGEEYIGGAVVLAMLSIGFLIHVAMGPNGDGLNSVGRSDIVMRNSLISAGLNIFLNILMIPKFSYTGAALATVITYTFHNLINTISLYREMKIVPLSWDSVKVLLIGSFLGLPSYVGLKIFIERTLFVMIGVPSTFGIIYLFSIVSFGIIDDEIVIIRERVSDAFNT